MRQNLENRGPAPEEVSADLSEDTVEIKLSDFSEALESEPDAMERLDRMVSAVEKAYNGILSIGERGLFGEEAKAALDGEIDSVIDGLCPEYADLKARKAELVEEYLRLMDDDVDWKEGDEQRVVEVKNEMLQISAGPGYYQASRFDALREKLKKKADAVEEIRTAHGLMTKLSLSYPRQLNELPFMELQEVDIWPFGVELTVSDEGCRQMKGFGEDSAGEHYVGTELSIVRGRSPEKNAATVGHERFHNVFEVVGHEDMYPTLFFERAEALSGVSALERSPGSQKALDSFRGRVDSKEFVQSLHEELLAEGLQMDEDRLYGELRQVAGRPDSELELQLMFGGGISTATARTRELFNRMQDMQLRLEPSTEAREVVTEKMGQLSRGYLTAANNLSRGLLAGRLLGPEARRATESFLMLNPTDKWRHLFPWLRHRYGEERVDGIKSGLDALAGLKLSSKRGVERLPELLSDESVPDALRKRVADAMKAKGYTQREKMILGSLSESSTAPSGEGTSYGETMRRRESVEEAYRLAGGEGHELTRGRVAENYVRRMLAAGDPDTLLRDWKNGTDEESAEIVEAVRGAGKWLIDLLMSAEGARRDRIMEEVDSVQALAAEIGIELE